MSPFAVGCIGIATAFILIFLRFPIALAFGAVGFCGLWYLKSLGSAFQAVTTIPLRTTMGYVWTTIPMFLLLGYFAYQSGVIEEAYKGIRAWIGHFRGGLAHSIILGNAAYGAVSGSGIAAAVTFSVVTLPEMRKYGYADSLTLGSIAAGSLLAGLIPPSLPFIIFGGITAVSIGKLFISGIFPGLLLTALYMIVTYALCLRNPRLGPPGPKTTWREKIVAAPGMWVIVVTFVVLIGGLYMGIFTPTEGGAAAASLILVLGLARRKLSWQSFLEAIRATGMVAGMVFFLIVGVMIFNLFLVMAGVTSTITELMMGFSTSPTVNLLIVTAVFLFLGTFLDVAVAVLVIIPIIFPVLTSMGVDPLVIGVVVTITGAVGGLTPPYGVVVFAMAGIVKDVPMYAIFRGVVPFLCAAVGCVLVVIFFPPIATWLPSMMFR